MWQTDVCNSISLREKKVLKKLWKEGEEIKCLELFFFTDPWPLRKCFHVLCLSTLRAKKENILSSKPHATDSFWSQINQPFASDHVTLFVLCVIPNISCFTPPTPPPPRTHPPQAAHTHTQSEFPFPVRKITCTDRMACFNATCSGRKTGKGVQGCPTWNTRRVRGNPALMAALQFLETVSKVSSVFFVFCFFALALPSCALLLLVQECCRSMICLLQNNTYCIFQCKLMGSQGNTEYSLTF